VFYNFISRYKFHALYRYVKHSTNNNEPSAVRTASNKHAMQHADP